ncbi:hypothetical protein Calle1_73 [Cellulophaga phage Calle_1]|uniref:Uncharacterized protein n=1 Tax=Cellulophaga phage Calle_1 TaxID=2745643 RepID=A0A8E5EAZ7_9CAUD|nr:hypothetical protein M1M22_gp042 [Cellulophaga phage Calle_1]QQV89742.1 hypothetical protein Calle1_73 [Cellulophaga phage Calle_1]QQV89847.1 hypothetical protein Calle2_73 [Cellulophaga phage Calle_2]QQV89872.1 hypothetical protein Calle3_73 [Cellulophaga phage Calle_3]
MYRVKILYLDDWYTVYLDGVSIDSGHVLEAEDFLLLSEKHDFKHKDIETICVSNERDIDYSMRHGGLPINLNSLKGEY